MKEYERRPATTKDVHQLSDFEKAVTDSLMKIRTDLKRVLSNLMSPTEMKEPLLSRSEEPTTDTNDGAEDVVHDKVTSKDGGMEFIPDESGNVELMQGMIQSYNACVPALLARTMRRRANEVMRMLWPPETTKKLFVRGLRGDSRPNQNASDDDDNGNDLDAIGNVIEVGDYSKIINICEKMQAVRKKPVSNENDRVELNVRKWASDRLKNQRFKLKSTEKMQLRIDKRRQRNVNESRQ